MKSKLSNLLFYPIIYTLGIFTGIIIYGSVSKRQSVVLVTAPENGCKISPDTNIVVATAANTTRKQQTIREGHSLCENRGVNLVGRMYIDQSPVDIKQLEILYGEKYGGNVMQGGWYNPMDCRYRRKVAIIIPYRQRLEQLKIFLRHMHPMLQRQRLYYRIFVVEQLEEDPFNRAALLNVGFTEANKIADFDCFVFTDVDLLPEDDRNYYGCPTSPRHMSVAVDKFNYQLPYENIFGGCGSFNKSHFEKINGFSNLYFGWGGEDDDLYIRITNHGFKLTRPSISIGRYSMVQLNHFRSSEAKDERFNLVSAAEERISTDGLNSLKYTLKEVVDDPLLTYIKVVIQKSMYGR